MSSKPSPKAGRFKLLINESSVSIGGAFLLFGKSIFTASLLIYQ